MPISSKFLGAAILALQTASVFGDVYMHFPPGSNDRNRERNENRNNGNRLFDSQNNGKGGYPWCGDRELQGTWDGWKFYTGSNIVFEWTAQHGAGPDNNVDAQIILQYACNKIDATGKNWANDVNAKSNPGDPDYKYFLKIGPPADGLGPRDGYPTGPLEEADANNAGQYVKASFTSTGQNDDGTNRMQCPSAINCEGNFGDTTLDTDMATVYKWYDLTGNPYTGTAGTYNAIEFGYHETFQYYFKRCIAVQRNLMLYTADQQLNGDDARFTRQNPNGNRDGFECVEERDYYPWWGVSPWKDIAVLVSHKNNWADQCNYYQTESQNVKSRCYCRADDTTTWNLAKQGQNIAPFNQTRCISAGYNWVCLDAWGLAPPACQLHPLSRDNHLGNAIAVASDKKGYSIVADLPQAAHYTWTVPQDVAGAMCVLRIRYNLSSADYPQSNWNKEGGTFNDGTTLGTKDATKRTSYVREHAFFDARWNCPANTDTQAKAEFQIPTGTPSTRYAHCANAIIDKDTMLANQDNTTYTQVKFDEYVPVYDRPYLYATTRTGYPQLAMAFNTNQVARTFQDRSYVISFADGSNLVSKDKKGRVLNTIVNLNNRGRRGNIVQCYPAVENDFYPVNLVAGQNDLLHIQFCGSDFNPANNPNNGEGWQYSTRFNIMPQFHNDKMFNVPNKLRKGIDFFGQDALSDFVHRIAFADLNTSSFTCLNYQGDNSDSANNAKTNCAKLNPAKAHIDFGLLSLKTVPVPKDGSVTYHYVSTRNNNFSNRSNKGTLTVTPGTVYGLTAAEIAGIVIGVFLGSALIGCAAVVFYAKKNPNSRVAIVLKNKGVKGFTGTTGTSQL